MKIAAEAQHNHVKPADIMPDNIDLIKSKKITGSGKVYRKISCVKGA